MASSAVFKEHLIDKLADGDMLDVLSIEGESLLGDWISESFLEGGRFVVRLPYGGRMLHCMCNMDFSQQEPKIHVEHATYSPHPDSIGLPIFELEPEHILK